MPVPTPRGGESQDKFISRCMSSLADTDPDRPQKQRIAMCFSSWRKARGGKAPKESIKYLKPVTLKEALENRAWIGGTAIAATTSRNNNTYKVEGLEKNKTLEGTNLSVGHSEDPANIVGRIEETEWDKKNGNLNYKAQIFNTARYPDAIEMVKKKLWQFVSIEALPIDVKEGKKGLTVNDLEFIGLAFVKNPGVREASAALQGESFGLALEEAFTLNKNIKEDKYMEETQSEKKIEEQKVIEKVVYKTDPKVLELLEKLTEKVVKLEEQVEEDEPKEEETKEEAKEEEAETKEETKEETEEASKAVVQEEISEKPESNIVWEGTQTNSSFWVMPGPKGEFKEAI